MKLANIRGLAAASVLCLPGIAAADAPDQEASKIASEGQAPTKVTADLTLGAYVWLPSIGGKASMAGNDISLDLSFLDIFDDADSVIGFMGHAEVNVNRFLLLLDPVWMRMEKDDAARNVPGTDVTVETLWFDINAGYRFIDRRPLGEGEESPRLTVDGLAGGRITSFKFELDAPGLVTASQTLTWADPVVGTRVTLDLADHLGLVVRADIGGFGAGSDLSSNLLGAVGYRFPIGDANGAVFAGYRALYQDYEDGDFEWRAWVHGPIFGVQITF
jgi:hypothetical protein